MKNCAITKPFRVVAATAVAAMAFSLAVGAAGTVDTVGGGPSDLNPSTWGYTDGDTANYSQFHGPSGVALDSTGNFLFVADRLNNALRRLDLAGNLTATFDNSHLSTPVAVALDPSDNVYVLSYGAGSDGYISKFNKYKNFYGNLGGRLTNAAALTIDASTNIYVAEAGGTIKRITRDGVVSVVGRVTNTTVQLAGIALSDDGSVVVSDARNHALWKVSLLFGTSTLFTGGTGAGDVFGEPGFAKLNHPGHLARAGGNSFVLADTGNHRVKLVDTNGIVTPIYGIPSSLWYTDPVPGVYPGWYDGRACEDRGCAEAREPLGVVVGSSGDIYVSEFYYSLIRKCTGSGVTGPSAPPLTSIFNGPAGLAADSTGGFVFVADMTNNTIRRIELAAGLTLTFTTNSLNRPVAVVLDPANNLFVLNQGNGMVLKFNRFANLVATNATGLVKPTAMTMDSGTNLFVCQQDGKLWRITPSGVVTNFATVNKAGVQLRGIAVMDDGVIVVSDSGNQALWQVQPVSGTVTLLTGGNGAGSGWGTAPFVQFYNPQQVAKAGGNLVVVADQGNNRLLVVDRTGTATNLNAASASIFYGRSGDPVQPGSTRYAEMSRPVGVVVSSKGDVLDSENGGIVRWLTGTGLSGPGGTLDPGGSGIVLTPPAISPETGYFPMGQVITVTSPNAVYYTTDGTEPTTNSTRVTMSANTGFIAWNDSLHDLTSLKLKAFDGTNSSVVVSGVRPAVSELGVPRSVLAGSGATLHIPLVLNLSAGVVVRTLQYRVEIVPQGSARPVLPQFDVVDINTNDFIQVAGASAPGAVAQYDRIAYSIPNPANPVEMIPGGMAIFVIGTNANFQVSEFGTVAMLKVPIDPLAQVGDSYQVTINDISATSDGEDQEVIVNPMTVQTITVSNVTYTVGDSATTRWYAAGDFGDGDLKNSDVNNAFYASLGVRTPPTYLDVFDAMDAWPPDEAGMVGGDMQIRQADWETILMRSLRLDTNNYSRHWTVGGTRVSQMTSLRSSRHSSKSASPLGPGAVWNRQACMYSHTVTNATPGALHYLPVYLNVAPGCSVSGLSFRAVVVAEEDAPPVTSLSFLAATGKSGPSLTGYPSANQICCGWSSVTSSKFNPALEGKTNLVGYIGVRLPMTARAGQRYTLRFPSVDGLPNLTTQYDVEGVPASVWVRSGALLPSEVVSDQWKTNFFGSIDNPRADALADDDGDGVPNWMEYLAGTGPTDFASRLQVASAGWVNAPVRGMAINWLSAPGKSYLVERSPRINGTNWTAVAAGLAGNGYPITCLDTNATGQTQFYRVRLQP